MEIQNKIQAFEYVLFRLVNWHKKQNGNVEANDISVLKALKLLFFVSAVGTTKESKYTLLDEVFDNFVAMPYGHVESDIYSAIKSRSLSFGIDNSKTTIVPNYNFNDLDASLREKLDSAVNQLEQANPNLIKMNAFDLVELSHSWYSWKYFFAKAKKNNTYSEFIPSEIIKSESKFFYLS